MEWIEVNENILNLNFVESIIKDDREVSYAEPFLLLFNTSKHEYQVSFSTREAREKYKKTLLKKLQ